MGYFPPIGDDEVASGKLQYPPITKPIPIPPTNVFDSPTVCLAVNEQWVSHLLGVMDRLDQPDAWQGTELEIDAARQNVRELMNAFSSGVCANVITDVRMVDCVLQKQVDGVWIEIEEFDPACFTGPTGPTGPAGSAAAATMLRDTGNGQVQTSPTTPVAWTDVTNAKYVHTNGDIPMTGGLEILGSADEVQLTIRGVGAPYQTAKLVSFRDSANVERAWINPRGDMYLGTGVSPASNSLELESELQMHHLKRIKWETSEGSLSRIQMGNNGADSFTFRSKNGYLFYDDAGAQQISWVAGLGLFQNQGTGGRTIFTIRGGPSQSTNNIFQVQTNNGTNLENLKADGVTEKFVQDAATNAQSDSLILDHESTATPTTNFGAAMRFRGKSSTTASQEMARLRAVWETATHATRKASIILSAYDTGEREILRGRANGTLPEIGVLGKTPQPRITLTGDVVGNEALANLITIIEGFGFIVDSTTDTGVPPTPEPEPDVCALTRCNYTELAANWFAYEVWSKAVYEAGRSDVLLVALERLADINVQIDALYGKEDSDLYFWVTDVQTIFGGDEGDLEPLNTFIAEGVDYVLSAVANLLYCAVDDCGFIVDFKWSSFIAGLAPTTDAETKVKELLQTMELSRVNDMISHAIHSQYRQEFTMDCLGLDCDEWDVLFTTVSPDLSTEEGSEIGGAWDGCDGTTIRLRLSGFHVYYISFTTVTNVGDPIADPPSQIRAKEVTSGTWHYYAPHAGANDVTFLFDAPTGVDIEVSYDGTGAECVNVHALRMKGLGTAPTG